MRCCLRASVSLLFLLLIFPSLNQLLILPNTAGVVFGASDDRVALVVERTGENLVFVALSRVSTEALKLISGLS